MIDEGPGQHQEIIDKFLGRASGQRGLQERPRLSDERLASLKDGKTKQHGVRRAEAPELTAKERRTQPLSERLDCLVGVLWVCRRSVQSTRPSLLLSSSSEK